MTDHVLVEEVVDLSGLGKVGYRGLGGLAEFFLDDLVAQVDTFIADINAGARNELFDLFLALAAKGALEQISALTDACHEGAPSLRQTTLICPHHSVRAQARPYPDLGGLAHISAPRPPRESEPTVET